MFKRILFPWIIPLKAFKKMSENNVDVIENKIKIEQLIQKCLLLKIAFKLSTFFN